MGENERLPLFHFDVLRQRCPSCGCELFEFVPSGDPAPLPARCTRCGSQQEHVDLSDTSIRRLVTKPDSVVVRNAR